MFAEVVWATTIAPRVAALGAEITADYEGRIPVLLGILKGAVPFLADLTRDSPEVEIDFLSLTRFGDEGRVSIAVDLGDIDDRPSCHRGRGHRRHRSDPLVPPGLLETGEPAVADRNAHRQGDPAHRGRRPPVPRFRGRGRVPPRIRLRLGRALSQSPVVCGRCSISPPSSADPDLLARTVFGGPADRLDRHDPRQHSGRTRRGAHRAAHATPRSSCCAKRADRATSRSLSAPTRPPPSPLPSRASRAAAADDPRSARRDDRAPRRRRRSGGDHLARATASTTPTWY